MFNINFGKKRPDKKQLIIISAILGGIVATISQCTGVSSDHLFDLLDEIQRNLFPQTIINDVLLQDPGVVDRRVKRDVDKAIKEYERLTGDDGKIKMPEPIRSEKPIDSSVCYTEECQSLGGEIRICAPWVKDCK
jgi:hypothetical protein